MTHDAAIQRFEFTYELAWKLITAFLEYQGIPGANSPRSAFKEAFAINLIHDGGIWINMLEDRNLTAHTYDERKAIEIYNRIKTIYYPQLAALAQDISKQVG